MKTLSRISLLIIYIIITSCGNQDLDDISTDRVVTVHAELFELVKKVSADPELVAEPISCVQFVYPITLFRTNGQGNILSVHVLSDNASLYEFLISLPSTHGISISYPISSTAANGSIVIINNNEELLAGIENCVEEEEILLSRCNNLVESCLWKVGYSFEQANQYMGAVFTSASEVTNFIYPDLNAVGTWNFIIDENVLYSNINFPTASVEVQEYFNHNWKTTLSPDDDQIFLEYEGVEVILNKYCSTDSNECFDFNFNACEVVLGSRVSDYILAEYNECIYEILRILEEDTDNFTIGYFTTELDAENNINEIDQNVIYNNTSEVQELFARLYNIEEDSFEIVNITLISTECD